MRYCINEKCGRKDLRNQARFCADCGSRTEGVLKRLVRKTAESEFTYAGLFLGFCGVFGLGLNSMMNSPKSEIVYRAEVREVRNDSVYLGVEQERARRDYVLITNHFEYK